MFYIKYFYFATVTNKLRVYFIANQNFLHYPPAKFLPNYKVRKIRINRFEKELLQS